jgi:hypothetical protein
MLVPFVIDLLGMKPDPNWTPAQVRSCYMSFLGVWESVGLLAHDGDTLRTSRIYAAVCQLPQKVRPYWIEFLERAPLVAIGGTWDGCVSPVSIGDFCTSASLAFVEETRASLEFGLDNDTDELRFVDAFRNAVDICRLIQPNEANAFKGALLKAGTHIEIGATFQATWDARFKGLAKAPIKIVSVVDRYAATDHYESDQHTKSGLERFLIQLDRDAIDDKYVSLYSAKTLKLSDRQIQIGDIAAEIQSIVNRLPNRKIRRVKIYMATNAAFRDDGHDRFVRFGDYVWDIGKGLMVLNGPTNRETTQAAFKSRRFIDGYKQIEQDLTSSQYCDFREMKF